MTDTDVLSWWRSRSRRLESLGPGGTSADLAACRETWAGVRVLALGESTHGTREFFTLKHRIVEFLVREAGLRVLALEASESAALAVDDLVRDGVGSPAADGVDDDLARALAGLRFWTWRTREMLDLLRWLRRHNAGRPASERVRFVGIDPQHPEAAVDAVEAFLAAADPDGLQRFAGTLTSLRSPRRPDQPPLPESAREDCAALLEAVTAAVGSGADGRDRALVHAGHLVRSAELATASSAVTGSDSYYGVRDRLMADAVTAVAEETGGAAGRVPVALWAHNGHVSGGSDATPGTPMGKHLRERYGEAYYALGLVVGEGTFHARRKRLLRGLTPGPVEHRLPAPPPTALEHLIAEAEPEDHMVDLRDPGAPDPVARWLREPTWTRSFGAVAPAVTRLAFAPLVPAEFDGVAYVRRGRVPSPC